MAIHPSDAVAVLLLLHVQASLDLIRHQKASRTRQQREKNSSILNRV